MNKLSIISATIAAFTFATTVSAAEVSGEVNVEITENAAGKHIATTTLGVDFGASDLAFGSVETESVDGATFTIDTWNIGTNVGGVTVSFGKQEDLMVENDFEIVGGDTIAAPADDHESIMLSYGSATLMVGLTDVTADVTEVENVQVAYGTVVAGADVTGVVDLNNFTNETTVGVKSSFMLNDSIVIGGIATYGTDTELFGYEASAGYGIATGFVNGDDTDMLQNVGVGVSTEFNGLGVYAEGSYNIDAKDTTVGMGVTFNF